MATTQVSNITEFLAACADTSCTKIVLTADIDFTTVSSYPINIGSSCTEIDGGEHSFNNIACINVHGAESACIFKWKTTATRTPTFKNIKFNMMYVFNTLANQNSQFRISEGSVGNSSINYINCDIKFKAYLANKNPLVNNYPFRFYRVMPVYNAIECNIIFDIYLITASNVVDSVLCSDSFWHDKGFKDSIIKINIYDPLGWGRAASVPVLIYGTTLNNCGVFVTYTSDVDMVKQDDRKYVIVGNYLYQGYNMNISNSYFVYEDKGNVKLKPKISMSYFLTYSFYDKDKATWVFENCNYHLSSSQVMGLTTAQCKSRSTFEGPTAILPFKLKQDVEP